MEHDKKFIDLVYHLARLSLAGTRPDILMQIQRIERRIRSTEPEFSERLVKLVAEQPTQASPVRSVTSAALPVDADSRLQLAKVDYPVEVDIEPIWDDSVAGPLKQMVSERSSEQALRAAGLAPARSMLFVGPPGVGKTMAASWIAKSLGRPLITLDLAAVMNRFLGRTGGNIRQVLDYAKGINCVLFLDELDAVAKRRDDESEIGELKRLVTVLLQEIDGWPESGVLVAATNHPDLLDPAIWRRFDIIVKFPLPDTSQVRQQVQTLVGDHLPEAMLQVASLAYTGSSFSDIGRDLLRARREAIVHGQPLQKRVELALLERFKNLNRSEKAQVSKTLLATGMSVRQVNELTGIHRSTISKNKVSASTSSQSEEGLDDA